MQGEENLLLKKWTTVTLSPSGGIWRVSHVFLFLYFVYIGGFCRCLFWSLMEQGLVCFDIYFFKLCSCSASFSACISLWSLWWEWQEMQRKHTGIEVNWKWAMQPNLLAWVATSRASAGLLKKISTASPEKAGVSFSRLKGNLAHYVNTSCCYLSVADCSLMAQIFPVM